MTEEKEKSESREAVCKSLAKIKKSQEKSDEIQRNLTLFYAIIKTHPNYHHDDLDVRSLEHFLRDQCSKEKYWLNEEIKEYGTHILEYVKE